METRCSSARSWAWLALLLAVAAARGAQATAFDTVADHVLGQREFATSFDYFVNGTVFGAQDVAFDRSVVPNRVYVADTVHNRVLGWSDIERFRRGASADFVLGQPSLWHGARILLPSECPPPTATQFCVPNHVAVDAEGNLYVADGWNYRVLEFDSPFTTDKIADRVFGQASFTERKPPESPFHRAGDVTVDEEGNLWMIEVEGGAHILGFDKPLRHDNRPDRSIETVPIGGCVPASLRPCGPLALAVSPGGDLVVGDYSPFGGRLLVFRQPLATDLTADFSLPAPWWTLAFDDTGNLYFLDAEPPGARGKLRRYRAPVGPGAAAETVASLPFELISRTQLATDGEGNVYAGYDLFGNVDSFFYELDAPFSTEAKRIGRPRLTNRGFGLPDAIAIDRSSTPNHLYVTDDTNGRVLAWRDAAGFANGAPADLVIAGRDPNAGCYAPNRARFCLSNGFTTDGLAVDSEGNLWLSDFEGNRVLEFDRPFETDLVPDRVLGQGGSFDSRDCNRGGRSARSLCMPGPLAFDSRNNLYAADLGNNRVLLFRNPLHDDFAAKVFGQTSFRQGECNQGRPGPSASTLCLAKWVDPNPNPDLVSGGGLAVDARGNLYVADAVNTRVLIFRDALTSDAVADRLLGQNNRFDTANYGSGPRRFNSFKGGPIGPAGLAVGPEGELYVADTQGDRVLEFAKPLTSSVPTRVFGHADFTTPGVGVFGIERIPAPTASNLLRPMGLAVDSLGNLYVADSFYNRVLRFDQP
jgi:sugar lactone lactonase YvrE